ncbi:hypothetical protein E4V99_04960 [Microbacterium sp. dk485]|uniref:hypothetical protein n=1 Tax=Microbacterium sp. dk485 TaxID=2560021 RepID=UPI001073271A|nr:hypothetical protein [Microbacterium sp. dk485]TFV84414.1 hypothetical protein E4V99_04960 [Microbacterium sp. dk485]
MSASVHTGDPGVAVRAASSTRALRNLYFARFGFAVTWAILLIATATSINAGSIALLVIYPLFDVAAAIIDFRSSGSSRPKAPLYINIALSLAAAIGLAAVVGSGIPDVLRVWGIWAITAGIVQLIVAVLRWRIGGQLAQVLSGGLSVFAGAGFLLVAAGPNAALTIAGGYAALGGVFFLISAIQLHRVIRKAGK